MMIYKCKIKTLLILIASLIYRFTMIDKVRKTLNEGEGVYINMIQMGKDVL